MLPDWREVERRRLPCGGGKPTKGCGGPIVWVRNEETGKNVPLDPRSHVYRIVRKDDAGRFIAVRDREAMVSHFQTCPKARDFSGTNRGGRAS